MALSDQEFQRHVTDSLARLETNMLALVGTDGTGGRLEKVETRVSTLEHHDWKRTGFIAGIGSVVGTLSSFLISYWRHG